MRVCVQVGEQGCVRACMRACVRAPKKVRRVRTHAIAAHTGIADGRCLGIADGLCLGIADGLCLGIADGLCLSIADGMSISQIATVPVLRTTASSRAFQRAQRVRVYMHACAHVCPRVPMHTSPGASSWTISAQRARQPSHHFSDS